MEANWTCPFCTLLCDGLALEARPEALVLHGCACARAQAGLAAHARHPVAAAFVDGRLAPRDLALAEAARRLARWRQPLLGGLGTDVAGARALGRLADRIGAVCDHADGDALAHALRALQDRGQFHTTLAEVRARADLMVCIATDANATHPEFFRRCGLHAPDSPCRRLVFLGAEPPPGLPGWLAVECVPGSGNLLAELQQLAALVAAAPCREPDAALVALAAALHAARYAVLVWDTAALPPHGALALEMLHRVLQSLNRGTRAAGFALGGGDGAATVQQVFTWLSGLPLRTRHDPGGGEHDPLRFAGPRLLADRAVDGLLWIWSFDGRRLPPTTDLPRIVLGTPALGAQLAQGEDADDCVFLPVATPGVNAAGHLFRADGVVVPLVPARDDGLPGVDRIVQRLLAALGDGP